MSKSVKIYTLSTCGHCKATKKLLSELDVDYDYTDVDKLVGEERKTTIEDVRRLNPKISFPTIVIGDKIIVGHKENEIREALGL